jgi:hypothetical protein
MGRAEPQLSSAALIGLDGNKGHDQGKTLLDYSIG